MRGEREFGDFWRCSIAVYDVVLRAVEELHLPSYKGSTLKGAIGNSLYAAACRHRRKECPCNQTCPYAVVFEPKFVEGPKNPTRAYVIEPPLDPKVIFQPGELLSFRLLLFGKGIRYFPWFIVALQSLEQFGIGKGRRKLELLEIHSVHPLSGMSKPIYLCDSETGLLPNESLLVHEEEIIQRTQDFSGSDITLEFLTPTRIKSKSWGEKRTFVELMRAILRRAQLLSKSYGRGVSSDRNELLKDAENIALKLDKLKWYDWKRYSMRRQDEEPKGGVIGRISYASEKLPIFMPYLLLGQLMHVGKGYVYGMGKYVVRNGDGELILNELETHEFR